MNAPAPPRKTPASARDARLKAALKANLARRKAQAREKADHDTDDTGRTDDTGDAWAQDKG